MAKNIIRGLQNSNPVWLESLDSVVRSIYTKKGIAKYGGICFESQNWGGRGRRIYKFKSSMVNIASSRPAKAT